MGGFVNDIEPPAEEAPDIVNDPILKQLEAIAQQNRQITEDLHAIRAHGDGRRFHVKIADANMPFFALVGLLVKIALASIPAMIILGAFAIGLVFLTFAIIAGFGIGVGSLATLASTATPIPERRVVSTATPVPTSGPTQTAVVPLGPLDMFAVSNRIEGDNYIVEGQVKNLGIIALEDAVALVVFSRENDTKQEVRVPIAPIPLAPGDIGTFSASTPAEGVSSFRVDFANQSGRSIPFQDTAP